MAGTIKNKTLAQCLEELQKPQKPDDYLLKKYPFYKIESYFKRINSIFGLEHYNVTYPMVTEVASISNGQEFMTVKCHLEILDDDGNVVLVREGLASKEISFNDQGKEVNLKNLYRSTSQLAFKAAWDHLNIFGKAYEEDNESEVLAEHTKPQTPPKPSNNNSKKEETSQDVPPQRTDSNRIPNTAAKGNEPNTYELYVLNPIKIEREDRSGPVYFALGELPDKTQAKAIFYPNQYLKNEEAMNQMIKTCQHGMKTIKFKASSSGTRDGFLQLIVKGF